MFTGIIEAQGVIRKMIIWGSNKSYWIKSSISRKLKPDQSLAHDGVCLTVEEVKNNTHKVTAIAETLRKTALEIWEPGTVINLERCLKINDRLDGHFVQGHVDSTGTCISRLEKTGSWEFRFQFPSEFAHLIIEKGSITVNGISLTAFNVTKDSFEVAIIPYTFDHTNMNILKEGNEVNLEFDILGKYMNRMEELKYS